MCPINDWGGHRDINKRLQNCLWVGKDSGERIAEIAEEEGYAWLCKIKNIWLLGSVDNE